MKVAELEDLELDYWVARAEGHGPGTIAMADIRARQRGEPGRLYSPSTNWMLGGPIIERERISLSVNSLRVPRWEAFWQKDGMGPSHRYYGETPLVAAMRCFVASKSGEEVPDAQT